jgi:hypothetical protein
VEDYAGEPWADKALAYEDKETRQSSAIEGQKSAIERQKTVAPEPATAAPAAPLSRLMLWQPGRKSSTSSVN